MADLDAKTIQDWLGITEHGADWRRHAMLQYRQNPLMEMAYKDLSDDEFIAVLERSIAARRKRADEEDE